MIRFCLLLSAFALVTGCKSSAATTVPGDPVGEPGPSVVAADIDVTIKGPGPRVPQDLDVLLDEVLARSQVPGIAAAVIDASGVLAIGAAGRRRADVPGDLRVDDRFHLGSDTKAMTAVLVARLVEAGVLRWDTTMAEAFPDAVDGIAPEYRDVTITQLLRHRGGVATEVLDFVPGLEVRLAPMLPEARRKAVALEALAVPPRFTPGSKFEYTNFGYVIVGAAIEVATGTTWEAELEARVFEPLKMASCGFGPTSTGDDRDGSWAHVDQGEQFVPVELDNPPFLGPAGSVHCSLKDWGAFTAVFFEGASFLSEDARDRLTSPVPTDDGRGGGYALGWAVPEPDLFGLPVLTHDGSNTVNYASAVVMPTLGAAVLVAVNAGGERAQKAVVATALELARRVRGPHDGEPEQANQPD